MLRGCSRALKMPNYPPLTSSISKLIGYTVPEYSGVLRASLPDTLQGQSAA